MSRNSGRRAQGEQNVTALKSRITDLEAEVSRLKSRLDELRKAKNNTILKREREVIHVGEPTLGRPVGVETSKYRELEKKLSDADCKMNTMKKEIADLKEEAKKAKLTKAKADESENLWKEKYVKLESDVNSLQMNHEIELSQLQALTRDKSAQIEDLTTELERLRERLEVKAMQEEHKGHENSDRESHISALTNENAIMRDKIDTLFHELSVKEAQWLEKEEKFTRELKNEWGERYATWMAATEKKLQELHEANEMLKSCLHNGERRQKEKLKGFDEEDEREGNTSQNLRLFAEKPCRL